MLSPIHEIQRMHETETVRRESIIAWYAMYRSKLPPCRPERSDVDLIRTVALWMELTDRGGQPGFPYQYKSELSFPSIDPQSPARPNWFWLASLLVIVAGLVAFLFDWRIGIALLLTGGLGNYFNYRIRGGAGNPDLIKEGTALYEKEARPVLEWASSQSAEGDLP